MSVPWPCVLALASGTGDMNSIVNRVLTKVLKGLKRS